MDGHRASFRKFGFKVSSRMGTFAKTVAMVFGLTLLTTPAAQAQTFSVLHYFTGGEDGSLPVAGVTVGPGGVLYGTASQGGNGGYGTVFKLRQVNSSWIFSVLYGFSGGNDGYRPIGGVVIGPNDALYGTTQYGGGRGYGTVYELRPPAAFCRSIMCYWNETVLYAFRGPSDGEYPYMQNLAFDQAGEIYGTTLGGGGFMYGTTFKLTPSGGGYTESILHSFGFGTDGADPFAGVVLDAAGNAYGTTAIGGTGGDGTLYQLMPSGGEWVENVLVNFDGANGVNPMGNLIIDASGNLYGTTINGGQNDNGLVFKLAPSNGGWNYSVLYSFGTGQRDCQPYGGVAMDAAGDLFGVCPAGAGAGWIFELTNCSTMCIVADLHDFSGSDGAGPWGAPVLDADGNLYGITEFGGTGSGCGEGCGVVWEIAGVGAPLKK